MTSVVQAQMETGHDLIVLNYCLKPILFIVAADCIGGASEKSTTKTKKIGKSIWSKTTSKIDLNAREIPFKIHQTLQIFSQYFNSILQLPK